MSATSMLEMKAVRETDPAPPAPGRPGGTVQPVGVGPEFVAMLVKFIPTEAVALYVAYLTVLKPAVAPEGKTLADADYSWRWAGLVAFAVLASAIVVGLAWGGYVRRRKQDPQGKPFSWPAFEMTVSPIAFTAWALALPDTPLNGVSGYRIEIGGFILLVTTFAIAFVAWMLDKTVSFEKVVG